MNKQVAVILPVYKKDKVDYLSKAIESIVMQTYREFHIYIGVDLLLLFDAFEYHLFKIHRFMNIFIINPAGRFVKVSRRVAPSFFCPFFVSWPVFARLGS